MLLRAYVHSLSAGKIFLHAIARELTDVKLSDSRSDVLENGSVDNTKL